MLQDLPFFFVGGMDCSECFEYSEYSEYSEFSDYSDYSQVYVLGCPVSGSCAYSPPYREG